MSVTGSVIGGTPRAAMSAGRLSLYKISPWVSSLSCAVSMVFVILVAKVTGTHESVLRPEIDPDRHRLGLLMCRPKCRTPALARKL